MNDYQAHNTYQTGSTQPPKSRKGLLASVLMVAIFFSGMISALSLMNVNITESLEEWMEPDACTVSFTDVTDVMACADSPLGFEADAVSPFWRTYQRLPEGLYITQVDHARQAARLGICPGDILLNLDGTPVTDWESLNHMLSNHGPGDRILLTLYRDGSCQDIWLTLYE